jgi:hypothetical protein
LSAALPRERQVALDAPDVEVQIEAADDERDVDVRGDDLRLRLGPGDLAHERAASRQDRMDCRAALVGARSDGDPVADRRVFIVVTQLAGELSAELALLRIDDIFASMFHGHARGREAVVLERPERVGERGVPAQGLEMQRDLLLRVGFRGLR